MPNLLYFAVEHPNLSNGRKSFSPRTLSPLDQIEDVMAGWAMSRIGREPTLIEVIDNLIPSFPCIPCLEEVSVGPDDPRTGLVGQLDVRIKPGLKGLEPGSVIGPYQARHRFFYRQEEFAQARIPPEWYEASLPDGYDPGIKELDGWPEVRSPLGVDGWDVARFLPLGNPKVPQILTKHGLPLFISHIGRASNVSS